MANRYDNTHLLVTKFKDCFLFYRDTVGFDVLYYYKLAISAWAALGDQIMALNYLQQVVDRGWSAVGTTQEEPHFQIMHDLPEWATILAHIEKNSARSGNNVKR